MSISRHRLLPNNLRHRWLRIGTPCAAWQTFSARTLVPPFSPGHVEFEICRAWSQIAIHLATRKALYASRPGNASLVTARTTRKKRVTRLDVELARPRFR